MRTPLVSSAIHRRLGVLLAAGGLALSTGAALHVAPASANDPGPPPQGGLARPPATCGGCVSQAPDRDPDHDGLATEWESKGAMLSGDHWIHFSPTHGAARSISWTRTR